MTNKITENITLSRDHLMKPDALFYWRKNILNTFVYAS